MKHSSILKLILPVIAFLILSMPGTAFGQGGGMDWSKDTLSETTAKNAQYQFRNEWSGAGKKTSASVTMPVSKLNAIMEACAAKGITEVDFLIVKIRAEDADHYARQKPGMSENDKKDMIGRQMLVVKVPREAFFPGSSGSRINKAIPGNNPLMLSLLGAGLFQIENPEGTTDTQKKSSLYFSIAKICPPPSICGD